MVPGRGIAYQVFVKNISRYNLRIIIQHNHIIKSEIINGKTDFCCVKLVL